jgi:TonB family protein
MNLISIPRICILLAAFLFASAQLIADNGDKKNGKVKTTHTNGAKASRGKVKNYQKQGTWKYWDEYGVLLNIENYNGGILDGDYMEFHSTGKVSVSGKYINGRKNGEWISFHYWGFVIESLNYSGGNLHGLQKYFFGPNEPKEEAVYENGSLVSRKQWYMSGRLFKTEQFINGKRNGKCITYSDNPKDTFPQLIENYSDDLLDGTSYKYCYGRLINESNYVKGKLHGKSKTWHYHGVLQSEENYLNGKLDGELRYWRNGILRRSATYSKGLLNGKSIIYDKEGNMKSYEWFTSDRYDSSYNFRRNGNLSNRIVLSYSPVFTLIYQNFNENGIMIASKYFSNNLKTGKWTTFYDSGSRKSEKDYQNDTVNGKCRYWYENGKEMIEADCRKGIVISPPRVWDESGKSIKNSTREYYTILYRSDLPETVNYDPYRFIPSGNVKLAEQIKQVITETGFPSTPDMIETELFDTTDDVFTLVELMPEFPGGEGELNSYIKQNLNYPSLEKESGKSGLVILSFIVKKDGSISTIRVEKEVKGAPGLTKEAIRIVSQMPLWIPGEMQGDIVQTQMSLPIRFVLK